MLAMPPVLMGSRQIKSFRFKSALGSSLLLRLQAQNGAPLSIFLLSITPSNDGVPLFVLFATSPVLVSSRCSVLFPPLSHSFKLENDRQSFVNGSLPLALPCHACQQLSSTSAAVSRLLPLGFDAGKHRTSFVLESVFCLQQTK